MAGRPGLDFLPGTRFGLLKVISKVRTPPGASGGQRYRLECDCGNRITKPRFYLVRKQNPLTHCGCLQQRADPEVVFTKRSWYAMHSRCEYEGHVSYAQYGGRGITVCERWHKDNPQGFENFLADMGHRPKGMSLDRWPDNNKGYEPGNCRWATASQQTLNQRHRQ
jgi:hypothetical protein